MNQGWWESYQNMVTLEFPGSNIIFGIGQTISMFLPLWRKFFWFLIGAREYRVPDFVLIHIRR